MMRNCILNIFGIGKWPFSASLASLLVVPVYYFSSLYLPYALYINVALFLLILLWSMVELHRNSAYAETDAKEIVIDELLGMHSSLIIACTSDPLWIAILFVLFRVFDTLKVFPVNIVERKLKGTYGLLWDDIAIGVSCGILFTLANHLFVLRL